MGEEYTHSKYNGSLYISGKLPTYPSPKPTFCTRCEVSFDVGLGEGEVGNFPEMYNDPQRLNYYAVKLCYLWLLCLCGFA